ncbi:E3 ubiquitin-protein ligase RFWD2 [Porphyridium purpureum]|uniref:E3 ubiquitin-protein ligase RFWD2 n=1 Tax=Porphyridium purpureum TaxID=35688 RepID=A0A5J4YMX9_PORPP|nr:E3 ubiquitin-protein ligase RFWD2 [Porphyridium purpureum]|eukprot:POR2070..scf222_8
MPREDSSSAGSAGSRGATHGGGAGMKRVAAGSLSGSPERDAAQLQQGSQSSAVMNGTPPATHDRSRHAQRSTSLQHAAKRTVRACPICFNPPKEPFVTDCAHTFCFECISRHLQARKNCPSCRAYLTAEMIQPDYGVVGTPNHSATNGLARHEQYSHAQLQQHQLAASNRGGGGVRSALSGPGLPSSPRQQGFASNTSRPPTPPCFEPSGNGAAMEAANADRRGGGRGSTNGKPSGGLSIGNMVIDTQGLSASKISELIGLLQQKQQELENNERGLQDMLVLQFLDRARREKEAEIARLQQQCNSLVSDIETIRHRDGSSPSLSLQESIEKSLNDPQFYMKKKRIDDGFNQLEERYLTRVNATAPRDRQHALDMFADDLASFTKYSTYKCIATLKHGARHFEGSSGTGDLYGTNNIVSSIEFDRDSELIATAGVMKRIKIFELGNMLNSRVEIHYPVREMVTRAKLSCLAWNSYIRSHLISSDYEGVVTLWDTHSCRVIAEFEEHEKRAWCVDFSSVNPTLFASASDDGRVKIWSTTQLNSATTIENRANVCCVKFNPDSAHHIAFGSADHNVHYYDLRYPRDALSVFRGHSKAVSYVKFLSGTEIVSASTDSFLKLWSAKPGGGLESSFQGHKNDKNFVGLSVHNNYISCGSEDNCVYTYYKSVSKPLLAYKFGSMNPITGEEVEDVGNQFVSSVCWCPNRPNMLLAANSAGIIKVLELE